MNLDELLKIRQSAYDALVTAPARMLNTEWARDRMADIEYVNRVLKERGLIP